jgi:nitrate/nitrite-specific signal transduction histidine kinase
VLNTSAPQISRPQNILAHMRELAKLRLVRARHTFAGPESLPAGLLSPAQRKELLLFFKEAISNAEIHSDCRMIEISVALQPDRFELVIRDDGRGIDEARMAVPATLRTLKRRAANLVADLEIQSKPGAGTRLHLVVPTKN